jgi:hypothetical protein
MTQEERITAIQELVATIPADKEGLWKWQVKWENLDDVLYILKTVNPYQKANAVSI